MTRVGLYDWALDAVQLGAMIDAVLIVIVIATELCSLHLRK